MRAARGPWRLTSPLPGNRSPAAEAWRASSLSSVGDRGRCRFLFAPLHHLGCCWPLGPLRRGARGPTLFSPPDVLGSVTLTGPLAVDRHGCVPPPILLSGGTFAHPLIPVVIFDRIAGSGVSHLGNELKWAEAGLRRQFHERVDGSGELGKAFASRTPSGSGALQPGEGYGRVDRLQVCTADSLPTTAPEPTSGGKPSEVSVRIELAKPPARRYVRTSVELREPIAFVRYAVCWGRWQWLPGPMVWP